MHNFTYCRTILNIGRSFEKDFYFGNNKKNKIFYICGSNRNSGVWFTYLIFGGLIIIGHNILFCWVCVKKLNALTTIDGTQLEHNLDLFKKMRKNALHKK